jgi:hypothetical protein
MLEDFNSIKKISIMKLKLNLKLVKCLKVKNLITQRLEEDKSFITMMSFMLIQNIESLML